MVSSKRNFIYNSLYSIISILIPLATTPYLSRVIGAEGVGSYAYAYSIASYFSMLIKLGLNNYGSREIASYRHDKEVLSKEFWEIYILQFAIAIIGVTAYAVYCIKFLSMNNISMILILSVISSGIDITWFFSGMEEFKLTIKRDFVIRFFTVFSIFVFVKDTGDVWKYTLILSMSSFYSQILLWTVLKRYICWFMPTFQGVLRHFIPNFILFIPAVAVSIYKTMDKIMLGIIASTSEVGYYQSSESIIHIPMALITSLGTVMQPRMCRIVADKRDPQMEEKIFIESILLAVFLSTSLGFGIMTVAEEFVPLFYGEGFEKCCVLYKILLPSCMFMAFANVVRTQLLIPHRKDLQYIGSLFAGAAVNLGVNILLIYRWQSIGVAVGTLLAEMTVCLMQILFGRKLLKLNRCILKSIPFILSGELMYLLFRNIYFGVGYLALVKKILVAGSFYLLFLSIICIVFDLIYPSGLTYKNILCSLVRGKRK